MEVEYLVVGSGLTGAVIARMLTDASKSVIVVDRRSHVGGNVYDRSDDSGIRIHSYGPHYFRTSSDLVWKFLKRFTDFYLYEAEIKSNISGSYVNWPISKSYIKQVIGVKWTPDFVGEPSNFEEAALSLMPRVIYERFVKEYNEKQWGVPAVSLSASLCKRFEVRDDDDPRLTPQAKYQGIPTEGYSKMMDRLLTGIPVFLNIDYLTNRDIFKPSKMTIFTGPIDEYFNFTLGKLAYRGQKRVTQYLPGVRQYQVTAQVNEPLHIGGPHIRTLEWKQMMLPELGASIPGTVITKEIPHTPSDPESYEYPFPDDINKSLYQAYRLLADDLGDVLICGRLGEYKYFDMDHAIARAMTLTKRLLKGYKPLDIVRGGSNYAL